MVQPFDGSIKGKRRHLRCQLKIDSGKPRRPFGRASVAGQGFRRDTGRKVENRPGHKPQRKNLNIAKFQNLKIDKLNNLKII
jgi:hypothetical protein